MAAVPNPSDLTRHQLDELDALLQKMLALPLHGTPSTPTDSAAPVAPVPQPSRVPTWRADPPHAAPLPASVPTAIAALPRQVSEVSVPPLPTYTPPTATNAAASMPVSYTIPIRAPKIEPIPEREGVDGMVQLFGPPPRTAPKVEVDAESGILPEPRTLRGIDAPPIKPVVEMLAPLTVVKEETKKLNPNAIGDFFAATPSSATAAPAESAHGVPLLAWPIYAFNWVIESILGLFGPLGTGVTAPPVKNLLGISGIVLMIAAGLWAARGLGLIDLPLSP